MQIIAKIKPLYDDLLTIGLADFIGTNEFLRIANELDITDQYVTTFNEIQASATPDWLGLNSVSYNDVLASYLNKLFDTGIYNLLNTVSGILEKFIPHSYFIPSIIDVLRDFQLLGASSEQIAKVEKAWIHVDKDVYKKVMILKDLLTSRATGGNGNEEHFLAIRRTLIDHPIYKKFTPEFVINNSSLQEFWQFIKHHLGSYAERRFYIKEAFEELLNATYRASIPTVHSAHVAESTQIVDEKYISETWAKALERMKDDPGAAITSARTLIEMVCKHVLDSENEHYDDGAELPKLYKQTASCLNLAPDQHTEAIFKQILGGCQTVVEGLGALRNKLGDAHGLSKNKIRPSSRHAALAVNLSGSMCDFLLQTLNHKKNQSEHKA